MTPKERVRAALEHREPDRVPVGEMAIDFPITERALSRPTLYRAKWNEYVAEWEGRREEIVASYGRDIVDLTRHFDLDYLAVPLVPPRRDRYSAPEMVGEYRWRDATGRVWEYSPESEGHAVVVEGIELGIEDVPMPPDPAPVDPSRLEAVEHVIRELGATHFIIGRVPDGSFNWQDSLGTMDSYLLKMIDDPAWVEHTTEALTRQTIAYAKAMLDLGCDAISTDADYCDNRGPIMGPALFRRFCLPSIKKQVHAVHASGGFFVKHSDGNNWPILDDYVEAGVDGWQGIQTRIGQDFRDLKERYGDKICFFGGVDVETLVWGNLDEVADQVRYVMHHAAPGGGLVLGSGHTLIPGVKYENYLAMLKAARDMGDYPIAV
jgi:uroporphyrinogen decarboxylase